jgi:biotin operon repressor/uncharacterized protein YcgL (UPF0745 family)
MSQREQVLARLKAAKGRFISQEELRKGIKMAPGSLSSIIIRLRNKGYNIDSKNKGYQLLSAPISKKDTKIKPSSKLQKVLETLQAHSSEGVSVQDLKKCTNSKKTFAVHSFIHALRQYHNIDTRDRVYFYKGPKKEADTVSPELVKANGRSPLPKIFQDLPLDQLRACPPTEQEEVLEMIRKASFYYECAHNYLKVRQNIGHLVEKLGR